MKLPVLFRELVTNVLKRSNNAIVTFDLLLELVVLLGQPVELAVSNVQTIPSRTKKQAKDENSNDECVDGPGHCGSFQSRVFNIGRVYLAKKKISLDPMAGSLAGRW